ncbi:type II toxin-antitoxin system VapC family toxin [Protaetiibacter larvae]|uniref:Ribonuclease VapC n=1 Tax=Protaetiibacter larvae TaxID=2592654 RepID=A0A5C1Y5T0_9MICO|nr:PIN domain-containing protein [Protaetiibacter larvae]QEO08758.1 type II toxin-antitoxin system VapC family toxin [Protaetiibacter larvae]
MIVLDASVMIAVLDSADAHSGAARELLRSHAADRLVAHRINVAEVLVQPVRAQRAAQASATLAHLGIEYDDEPDHPLVLAELRANTGLPMPDCCVLHLAIRERAAIASFDERLVRAARGLGLQIAGN